MRCPVCRAENEDPTCRRCRADLSPLIALESQRAHELGAAAVAAAQGQGAEVVYHAELAQRLRSGADALRWLALGHLLQRDFPRALAYYQRVANGDR
jgi:hypothetical protein